MIELQSLAFANATPVYDVTSKEREEWKASGMFMDLDVVRVVPSEEVVTLAQIRFSPGVVKQAARTRWLRQRGRRVPEGLLVPMGSPTHRLGSRRKRRVLTALATMASFKPAPETSPSMATAILDFIVKGLPELWNARYPDDLLFVECPLKSMGLRPEDFTQDWHLLRHDGSELDRSDTNPAPPPDLAVALRLTADLDDLPELPRTARIRNRKRRNSAPTEYSPKMLTELVGMLDWVPDPRRKVTDDYPATAIVAIICIARYAGANSFKQLAHFSSLLSASQREALGLTKLDLRGGNAGILRTPSDDMFNDFIRSARKKCQNDIDSLEAKFDHEQVSGDMGKPLIPESRVLKSFKRWLRTHGIQETPKNFSVWPPARRRRRKRLREEALAKCLESSDSHIFAMHIPGKNGSLYARRSPAPDSH